MTANRLVDTNLLRRFVPTCELSPENLQELARKARVETMPAGRALFKRGDDDRLTYYLLSGEVILNDDDGPKTISAAGNSARYPLDHHHPRHATATAATDIEVLCVDNDLLDVLLAWDQSSTGYLVYEIGDSEAREDGPDDWMTNVLRSGVFQRIPPANIQAIFMRLEAQNLQAGETVIRQGETGDFYYYVREGRALVSRSSSKAGKAVKLAELSPGSSFGEEALVSGAKRNATVTMLSDGVLMRLAKKDFDHLLKEPVLQSVSHEEASRWIREGASWLDVRLESEHRNRALPESINVPLYMLRIKADSLSRDRKYIVYCDSGRRSAAATYLLNERGFDAYVLDGGLVRLRQES